MDIEQLEALALGTDRSAALAALLPGTAEHDYWRGIALQHEGRLDEVDVLLAEAAKRHGLAEHVARLRRRQLILRAGADLPRHADALRREAGVSLDDRAEVVVQAQRFPTRIDRLAIAGRALVERERAQRPDLSTLTDDALPELVARALELTAAGRKSLLQRLTRANLPGLVALVAEELDAKSSSTFGSLAVHAQLTLAQLEEVVTLRPALRRFAAWVDAVVTRMRPPHGVDPRQRDEAERRQQLDRLWAFAATLEPTFNGLKSLVLYHRLDLDRSVGRFDRALFLTYLALPRRAPRVAREWLEKQEGAHVVQPGANDGGSAGLEPVADDEPLVREYLAHFLLEEDGAAFAEHLRAEWLEEQLATTRLLAGAPNGEHWAARLGPSRLARLNERVDIELTARNRPRFGAAESVDLEVDVKNVRELEVKVFRINAVAYFLARGAEVDTGVDLDGMVAQDERVVRIDMPSIRRTRQRIALPGCERPGTYVVELIGNGRSSRALIRKGSLRHDVRVGAAGTVVRIFDERGSQLHDARLWLAGRELVARDDGTITIPFSTRPGRAPMLLVHGEIAQQAMLDHPAEHVALAAGFHLERESLVPNRTARILCRPALTVGGAPVSVALLEDPILDVSVRLLDGTETLLSRKVPLTDDAEAVFEVNVPDGAVRLDLTLRGRVRVVSTQQTVDVSDHCGAVFNRIHATAEIEAAHLATVAGESGPEHTLTLLGKTGEPLGGRALALSLTHRLVRDDVTLTLETDPRGAIELGALDGITQVSVRLPSGKQQAWDLEPTFDTLRTVQARPGEPVLLPAPPRVGAATGGGAAAADLVLVELRGGAPARDCSASVALEARALVVTGLAPGLYRLSCRGAADVTIVVEAEGGPLLEPSPPTPLLREARVDGESLVIRTSGTSTQARLHVLGVRYRASNVVPTSLHRSPMLPRVALPVRRVSQYLSGRDIGDEYRYVIERRNAPRRPGTMLDKPGLLLAPWALRTTSMATQSAAAGGAYDVMSAAAPYPAAGGGYGMAAAAMDAGGGSATGFATLDWLTSAAVVLDNLRPDDDGVVRIPRTALGAAQTVRIVLVDPALTSTLEVALPPSETSPRDLRLRLALDPAGHFVEDRRAVAAPAGAPIVVEDVRTGRVELIATLERARTLLQLLGAGDGLEELAFLCSWSSLDEGTKRARYSTYACHEVHLFLWRKDPAFFAAVVRPHLANKRCPAFVDSFLLGEDLAAYLEPWQLGRLNAVERVLLGFALPAVRAAIARVAGDAVDLVPRDPGRDAHLLSSLLGAGALEDGPPFAAFEERQEAEFDEDSPTGENRTIASLERDGDAKAKRVGAPPEPAAGMLAAPRMRAASRGGGGPGGVDQLRADLEERERGVVLYRGADRTQEWAETGWWKRRVAESGPELVPSNRFWRDLGQHDGRTPFLSAHLVDCTSSVTDALCALAFLELPFVAEAPETLLEDTHLTVTPRTHALAARSRIVPIAAVAGHGAVLIGQSYLRADDRHEWDGAENREKYVTGELMVGVIYRCHVVVTNPTSAGQKLDVLLQIPRGAIPVDTGFFTRTTPLALGPYGTQSVEYAFYFPRAGRFSHFPAHVTRAGELLASAEPRELEVVLEPSSVDPSSWAYVSQHGTVDEVLRLLERSNLGRVDLGRIAWRMHDRDAFERITACLEARRAYHDGLWAYALAHHDRVRAAQWLRHQESFVREAGPGLQQAPALAELDPTERGWYEHLEYAPLVNARAHQLGAKRRILNEALAAQYRGFLEVVAHRPHATHEDLLSAVHYLFCLDRIDDALAVLPRIDPALVRGRMQYAYVAAYAACLRGDLAEASRLAAPWREHPVDRWRNRFAALEAMIDEAAGGQVAAVVDPDDRNQRMRASAAREPALDLVVERGVITLQHHALERCEVRFYRMDVELLFSRQPFVQGDVERFSWIEPGLVLDVALAGDGRTAVPIPPALAGANLVIEVVAQGMRKAVAHYAHDLGVRVAQAFGQIRVTRASTQAPLPATYVKVYARQSGGQVVFYKDGYTDPRGLFDYATLSTDDLDRVERFALLVSAADAGATIVETTPPPR